MRFGGRLAAAIEILNDIETRHRPASESLRDWGLSHRFSGSTDRAVIGNIVYDTLRNKKSAQWLMDDPSPRSQIFGTIILEWQLTAEELNPILVSDKFSPPALKDHEILLIKKHKEKTPPPEVQANCLEWCFPSFKESFGNEWSKELYALSRRPSLDFRVNTLLCERTTLLSEYKTIDAKPCLLTTTGIRIPKTKKEGRHPDLCSEPSFQKGFFEIQDEGSQAVAQLSQAKPDDRVLDLCAGAGGKTLALAALMKNKGHIIAYDKNKARLAPIFARLKRAEVTNVEVFTKWQDLQPYENTMDLVFADVPCTGSGVWRRRPDAKWRLTQERLKNLLREQEMLLHTASSFVKTGGKLIYVTCSIFYEENNRQILNFRKHYPNFIPSDFHSLCTKHFSTHKEFVQITEQGISFSPFRSKTDGFFFSCLEKKA